MKEKELRKLGRLDLLEMLLDVSKENKELKEQIEKLETERNIAKGIDDIHGTAKQLSEVLDAAKQLGDALEAAKQLEGTLETAASLVSDLKTCKIPEPIEKPSPESEVKLTRAEKRKRMSDRNLYYRILDYYASNPDLLDDFPDDLRIDLINKLLSILEG